MKRIATYISGTALLLAGVCISCQKESVIEKAGTNSTDGDRITVTATIENSATKVSFTEDNVNNKLKTSWEVGDNIVGWDADGHKIELTIADADKITGEGVAVFTPVSGSADIPASGNVYMIYAPGKSLSDVSDRSLIYDLTTQDGNKIPALMTATGEVEDNVLELTFANQLAIVAVKNPTFPVTEETAITGLKLSGSNILTKATFSMDDEALKMESSEEGDIARGCSFTTEADGTTTETMVYFAVLPNSTAADVTVSTKSPEGYQISFEDKKFEAGKCYLLDQKTIDKQTFAITAPGIIEGGTITTDPSGSSAWGEIVTVTATPSDGYELATLTYNDGADHDIKAAGTFTMPQKNVTVSGTFQLKDFAITATGTETSGTYAVEGGTYTVKSGSPLAAVTTAKMGETVTVTPAPNTGYSGGEVTVKETTSGNSVSVTNNTFNMPAADVTITVTFTHDQYNISSTITPTSSGTVTFKKSGSDNITKAYYNDAITVDATPATGYELESIKWTYDGGSEVDITADKKFTMPAKNVTVTVTFKPVTGVIDGHNYVKIGSKKWATTNLGATNPQDNGEYFQWGETAGHKCNGTTAGSAFESSYKFGWSTTPFNGEKSSYDETTFNSYKSTCLTGDNLKSDYDAAFKATGWGDPWHMPTKEDFADLAGNGVWIWTTSYNSTGKSGYIVYVAQHDDDKGKANMNGTLKKWNGSSYTEESVALKGRYSESSVDHIFFPIAGRGYATSLSSPATSGFYWSSSLYTNGTDNAYNLSFGSSGVYPQDFNYRYYGFSVRPVSD